MGLVARSWLWMSFVTTPVTIVLAGAWLALLQDPGDWTAVVVWFFIIAIGVGLVGLGGAVVAAPFTHGLGRLLTRRPLRRGVHVVAHALLAGTLAALGTALLGAWWSGGVPAPVFPLLVSAPAGAAAAIATWRATAPVRADPDPDPGLDTEASGSPRPDGVA